MLGSLGTRKSPLTAYNKKDPDNIGTTKSIKIQRAAIRFVIDWRNYISYSSLRNDKLLPTNRSGVWGEILFAFDSEVWRPRRSDSKRAVVMIGKKASGRSPDHDGINRRKLPNCASLFHPSSFWDTFCCQKVSKLLLAHEKLPLHHLLNIRKHLIIQLLKFLIGKFR